ncbi:hypothetical protein AMTR_s00055p00066540 [Amborella trichopoda]|uniref:Uncharacterized protein n=1 Tax=Amborella trichopoda TaxID=13333 RepID=U5D6Z8_AMBTC|nr:hypothetical protein AMTR_s00055p00066540 [Amborella trichopoda]
MTERARKGLRLRNREGEVMAALMVAAGSGEDGDEIVSGGVAATWRKLQVVEQLQLLVEREGEVEARKEESEVAEMRAMEWRRWRYSWWRSWIKKERGAWLAGSVVEKGRKEVGLHNCGAEEGKKGYSRMEWLRWLRSGAAASLR